MVDIRNITSECTRHLDFKPTQYMKWNEIKIQNKYTHLFTLYIIFKRFPPNQQAQVQYNPYSNVTVCLDDEVNQYVDGMPSHNNYPSRREIFALKISHCRYHFSTCSQMSHKTITIVFLQMSAWVISLVFPSLSKGYTCNTLWPFL